MNYNYIINPETNRKIKAKSAVGIKVIKKYIKQAVHFAKFGTALYPKYTKINNVNFIKANGQISERAKKMVIGYIDRLCGKKPGSKRCTLTGTTNFNECAFINNRCVDAIKPSFRSRKGTAKSTRRKRAKSGTIGRRKKSRSGRRKSI